MLSVVCWRWGTRYGVEYVNRLASMLDRHLHIPHQLFCITDDPKGLEDVASVAIWPADGLGRCRRLRIFDPSMLAIFGPRILQLDIDCVITGDITTLVDRSDPLVMWRAVPEYVYRDGVMESNPESGIGAYNTSMVLMNTGILGNIWKDYLANPSEVETRAKDSGLWTLLQITTDKSQRVEPLPAGDDDQAIVSLYAKPLNPPTWLERDGIYKWGRRGFSNKDKLPDDARMVFFGGSIRQNRPGDKTCEIPQWIEEHWR